MSLCRYLNKFTCKGTLRQVFTCLRLPPLLVFVLDGRAIHKQSASAGYGLQHNSTFLTPSMPHNVCIGCTLTPLFVLYIFSHLFTQSSRPHPSTPILIQNNPNKHHNSSRILVSMMTPIRHQNIA